MGVRARSEAREIVSLEKRYGLFIGGKFVKPRSGEWFPSVSPSSEETLAQVAQAGPQDVGLAVKAARGAYEDGWSKLPPSERAKYLFRIARILQERSRELAVLESLDGGKPIRESRDVDLPLAAAHSSTTRAGPTSSSTRSRTGSRSRSASPARSSPGTSRS